MTIDWLAFVTVVAAALLSACALVTVFSLALRFGDGEAPPWRRPISIVLFVVCVAIVLFGIYLIVPFFH
jgi:amino acid transporter